MTSDFGATLSIMKTLPPMVLWAPMTVLPPRMVAPGSVSYTHLTLPTKA